MKACDIQGALRLVAHGRGWAPGRWLAAAEAAMDDGAAQVLVATRGLVGEGWDYPPLNVLVDLSEVASSTATTQLRGRALRLDPAQPDKLASLWDVVVAHPAAPGDWLRLRRRHRHWWGPGFAGAVVTGPAKLHPLAGLADVPTSIEQINADSALAVGDEGATRRRGRHWTRPGLPPWPYTCGRGVGAGYAPGTGDGVPWAPPPPDGPMPWLRRSAHLERLGGWSSQATGHGECRRSSVPRGRTRRHSPTPSAPVFPQPSWYGPERHAPPSACSQRRATDRTRSCDP